MSCLFLNELFTVLDVNLSFDERFYATAGEVEYFLLGFVYGNTFNSGGKNEGRGEELLRACTVLVDHGGHRRWRDSR